MSLSKTEGRTSSSNLPDTLGSASVREKSLCFTQLSLSLNFVSALFCFLVFLFCSRHLERERELFGGITTEKLAYFAFEEERGKRKGNDRCRSLARSSARAGCMRGARGTTII